MHTPSTTIQIPDTKLARKAHDILREFSTELLYNHSNRVFFFAAEQGRQEKLPFDPELLYVSAAFHDLGLLIALYPVLPQASAIGSGLLVLMSLTTLSFLVTTPEAWVPALGDAHHGFPYLSGVGRLIVKDFIMLGSAVLTMADSAKSYLHRFDTRSRSRA